MRDVIRLASHARHHLAVFDDHTARPLYLGEAKRIATPAQRIVLHATDRGCTFPGCDAPGYLSEVHHIHPWAQHHSTNIDDLTFGCTPHHRLLDEGWTVRKRADGTTEWIPPPHHNTGRPTINAYHHPQRHLHPDQLHPTDDDQNNQGEQDNQDDQDQAS